MCVNRLVDKIPILPRPDPPFRRDAEEQPELVRLGRALGIALPELLEDLFETALTHFRLLRHHVSLLLLVQEVPHAVPARIPEPAMPRPEMNAGCAVRPFELERILLPRILDHSHQGVLIRVGTQESRGLFTVPTDLAVWQIPLQPLEPPVVRAVHHLKEALRILDGQRLSNVSIHHLADNRRHAPLDGPAGHRQPDPNVA